MATDPEFPHELLSLQDQPVVRDFWHHVGRTVGYEIPPSIKDIFLQYHAHCFRDPKPEFTSSRPESPEWQWQKLHSESIFGNCQEAVAATLYHRDNLLQFERELLAFPQLDDLKAALGHAGIGGGNTRKLDFEYHGFVFAYRRALDYLAQGVAAILKQHFRSFRRLPDLLQNHDVHGWTGELIKMHSDVAPRLRAFLGTETNRSTRDRIAHYEHVAAGVVNVNTSGLFLAGGGENLGLGGKLSTVIGNYIMELQHVLDATLKVLVIALPKVSRTGSGTDGRFVNG